VTLLHGADRSLGDAPARSAICRWRVEHDEEAVVAADARKALVERTAAAADNQAGPAGVTAADEDVIKAAKASRSPPSSVWRVLRIAGRMLRSAQQHPLERFKIHVALSHSPGRMAVAYSRAVCG